MKMVTNLYKDVTFVIQGALCHHDIDFVTLRSAKIIREFYPSAKIIISTWQDNSELSGVVDKYIINEDPGLISSNNKYFINYNRMVISTISGLKSVKTKYAVKIRSDFWFEFPFDFKSFYKASVDRGNTDACNILMCMDRAHHDLFAYNISDFFHFGKTVDLLKVWEGAEFSGELNNYPLNMYQKTFLKPFIHCNVVDEMDVPFHPEQALAVNYLKKIGFNHIADFRYTNLNNLYNGYIVLSNIFFCISRNELGLRSYKHPTPGDPDDCKVWNIARNGRTSRVFRISLYLYLAYRYCRVLIGYVKNAASRTTK